MRIPQDDSCHIPFLAHLLFDRERVIYRQFFVAHMQVLKLVFWIGESETIDVGIDMNILSNNNGQKVRSYSMELRSRIN